MARVFDQAVRKEPLPFQETVGRIVPVFIRALGIQEYYLKTQEVNEDVPVMNVRFIFPEAGMLAFYNYGKYKPAGVERYNYRDHDFHLTFSGEMRGDITEQIVFTWLRDYAREGGQDVRQSMADYLADPYFDLRETVRGYEGEGEAANIMKPFQGLKMPQGSTVGIYSGLRKPPSASLEGLNLSPDQ